MPKKISVGTIKTKKPWLDVYSSNHSPFPPNYEPQVIEVYDQRGLLWGLAYKEIFYESTRPFGFKPSYIAWYFDEELALFQLDNIAIVNRLEYLAINQIMNKS